MPNNQGRNGAKAAAPVNAANLRKQLLSEIRAMGGNVNPPSRNPRSRKPVLPRLRPAIDNFSASQGMSDGKLEGIATAYSRKRDAYSRPNRPKFSSTRDGDIIIEHSEYFAELLGSTTFGSTTFPINPGVVTMFPWLSAIASRFESYIFEKLSFEFCTELATTNAGSAILVVDTDASDPAPTTKTQALTYRNKSRSATWQESTLRVSGEDLRKEKSYFVRSGALAANQDIKLYDTGNLFGCASGTIAGNLGELYVNYRVKLMTPQAGSLAVAGALWAEYKGTSNANPYVTQTGNLPVTAASPVVSGTTSSQGIWTFSSPWSGVLVLQATGTGLTNIVVTGTATSTLVKQNILGGALEALTVYTVVADLGQTVIVTNSNTTISAAATYFGQLTPT